MAGTIDAALGSTYLQMFDSCIINPEKYPEIDGYINKMLANKATYDDVSAQLNIPWNFIAIIHCMEGDLNFRTHLHNGDPLTARTVHVPKGRPLAGEPPFSWEESAVDALTIEGFAAWTDWSIQGMLYNFEKYNGMGYRGKGINSPYLWSYSNYYTKGKYGDDGVYNSELVSQQCGAAVLLRRMSEKQVAVSGETDTITQIKQLGAHVQYDPQNYHADAENLQTLLNTVGLHLRVDGKAGDNTSAAYKQISGVYLDGDTRQD